MKKIINLAFIVLISVQTLNGQIFANQYDIENEKKEKLESLNSVVGLKLNSTSNKDEKSHSEYLFHELHDSIQVEDYQASKYILGETAFALEKGKVMYQNIMGGINTFSIGISDNFTLNLSTEIFNLLAGNAFILNINPKYSFKLSENTRFAIGHNLLIGFTSDFVEAIGSTYVVSTFGSKHKNVSVGLGVPYSTETGYIDVPIFQLGGTYPLSKNFSIMFETFFTFVGGIDGFISPQIRYTKNNITIDLGVINGEFYDNLTFPYLSASTLF